MQMTTIEVEGESFNVKRLTGFSLLNAVSLNGKLGEMYRDLIVAAIVDEKGRPMFSARDVEKMETAQFSALGNAVLELHSEEFANFQKSAVSKPRPKTN